MPAKPGQTPDLPLTVSFDIKPAVALETIRSELQAIDRTTNPYRISEFRRHQSEFACRLGSPRRPSNGWLLLWQTRLNKVEWGFAALGKRLHVEARNAA